LKNKYKNNLYNITKCQFILAKSVPEHSNRKADTTTTKQKKTTASKHYNIGNSRMKSRNYSGAVDAYKQALLLNPNDKKTLMGPGNAQAKDFRVSVRKLGESLLDVLKEQMGIGKEFKYIFSF
jgi:tetratricopeptide (TPR) repeat protein